MKARQKNKLRMYEKVQQFLENNGSVLAAIPVVEDSVRSFTAELINLKELAFIQGESLIGNKALKTQQKQLLIKNVFRLSLFLRKLTAVKAQPDLLEKVTITKKSFMTMYGNTFIKKAWSLLEMGNENVNQLMPYKIDRQFLDQLEKNLLTYEEVKNIPALGILERKKATRAIAESIKVIDKHLYMIDDILLMLDSPEFYNSYKDHRLIIDMAYGRKINRDDGGAEEE